MMKLKQRHRFIRREFEVVDNHIRIKRVTMGGTREWTVELETLGDEIVVEKHSNLAIFLVGTAFLLFAVFIMVISLVDKEKTLATSSWVGIILVYVFFGSILLLIPNRSEIHLGMGPSRLSFFLNSPSRTEVEQFIEGLKQKTRKVLRSKYGQIDVDLPEETMMYRLYLLKERDVITQKEYETLKSEYKAKRLMR